MFIGMNLLVNLSFFALGFVILYWVIRLAVRDALKDVEGQKNSLK